MWRQAIWAARMTESSSEAAALSEWVTAVARELDLGDIVDGGDTLELFSDQYHTSPKCYSQTVRHRGLMHFVHRALCRETAGEVSVTRNLSFGSRIEYDNSEDGRR